MIRYVTGLLLIICAVCVSCSRQSNKAPKGGNDPFLVVLGVAQDAGYPQAGCYQEHCLLAWNDPALRRKVVSLGLVDPRSKKKWLFEATPDMPEQLYELQKVAPDSVYELAGIFLTHGHIGHYTGLMYLGKESMNSKGLKVYAMERMCKLLSGNAPWDQLVQINNIDLQALQDSVEVQISENLSVMPFKVPHRDEYTETVGYRISGPGKTALFIPDIDKWKLWHVNLSGVSEQWDYAFVDATFYKDGELPGRDMSQIKHPFVTESLDYFDPLPDDKKAKVYFIHFNHTNPLLINGSEEQSEVNNKGYRYAFQGEKVRLN